MILIRAERLPSGRFASVVEDEAGKVLDRYLSHTDEGFETERAALAYASIRRDELNDGPNREEIPGYVAPLFNTSPRRSPWS